MRHYKPPTAAWLCCVQASLCEGEGKEKLLLAKADLEAKAEAQEEAQERLHAAREALNDKHRELLKTTRNDPIKASKFLRKC